MENKEKLVYNVYELQKLLGRWSTWGLVQRLDTTPYSYSIAPAGTRYLNKPDEWYTDRYQRNVVDIAMEVAFFSHITFWWLNRECKDNKPIYFVEAPFEYESNFTKQAVPQSNKFRWPWFRLIVVKCDSAFDALMKLEAYGLKWEKPLAQALVDAGLIRWKEPEPYK